MCTRPVLNSVACTITLRRTSCVGPGDETGAEMIAEYHCATCNETFAEDTVEGVLKRAAAHNHEHHDGPESITPELEAALRAAITTRD